MEGEGALSTSQAVLQQLPFLRRYARALSGSQASGDAYVAATLESLIASPQILEGRSTARVALYRLFTKIWNSVPVNGEAEASGSVLPPEQHLTQITPRPRQAFLLVALEGFSEEDAAEILECDLATLRALVEESGRELAAEIATDVLIIEDETFIAMDIEALVESLGHKVIGVARTHRVNRLVHRLISFPARWRLDHDFYAFPFELKLKNAANQFFAPPKPKVDAQLLEAEVVTC